MNFVVVKQVTVALEIADLDIGARHKSLRIGMKQQYRRSFHVLPVHQTQFLDQRCILFLQYLQTESVTPGGPLTKLGDRSGIEVLDGNTRQRNRVPMFSCLP